MAIFTGAQAVLADTRYPNSIASWYSDCDWRWKCFGTVYLFGFLEKLYIRLSGEACRFPCFTTLISY